MARKYEQTKRIENSYKAYKRDWYAWKIKGYAMKTKTPMSLNDYKESYRLAKLAKIHNIASSFAAEGRMISHQEAIAFKRVFDEKKGLDKQLGEKIEKQFSSVKKIKKNISSWTYDNYTGLQAVYLQFKQLFGEEDADELFGY